MYCLPRVVASVCLTCIFALGFATTTQAQFTIDFGAGDFTQTPEFNRLSTFDFSIGINEPLAAGGVYTNPNLPFMRSMFFCEFLESSAQKPTN